jgi:hypothetical protein
MPHLSDSQPETFRFGVLRIFNGAAVHLQKQLRGKQVILPDIYDVKYFSMAKKP